MNRLASHYFLEVLVLALVATSSLWASPLPPEQGESCRTELADVSLPLYATVGDFRQAPERQKELKDLFLRWLREARDAAVGPKGPWRTVEEKDFSFNLDAVDPSRMRSLIEKGIHAASKLAIYTSGAGLWSRGGSQVKALVPFNLDALMSREKSERLARLGEIVKADTIQKVFDHEETIKRVLGLDRIVDTGESKRDAVVRIRKKAENEIEALMSEIRYSDKALNALDLKFVNAALLSEAAGSYVTFDIWTSQQTHKPVAQYLTYLRNNFRQKVFSEKPEVDAKIKKALEAYFGESDRLGETHLFGYMEGVQGLYAPNGSLIPWEDPKAGEPAEGTEYIGEGPGMLKAYMDKTGRTGRLQKLGKTDLIFENIEVQNNWALLYGAYLEAGQKVAVVLVPQYKDEKGGNGFMVLGPDGREYMELHETAVMPESMKAGHKFFNTNTIIESLALSSPSFLDFEPKDNGLIYRAKANAGDITKTEHPAVIAGRRPLEYVNQKSYREILEYGMQVIDSARKHWASLL